MFVLGARIHESKGYASRRHGARPSRWQATRSEGTERELSRENLCRLLIFSFLSH